MISIPELWSHHTKDRRKPAPVSRKPAPVDASLEASGIIMSVSEILAVYITEGPMGGGNGLNWEVVSQPLLVVTLTDETHFINK